MIRSSGPKSSKSKANRLKFIFGGSLFFVAVVLLVISASQATAEFFITVKELAESNGDFTGENLRISGAVLGESIGVDDETGLLHFTIAHIPADEDEIEALGGLSEALHWAVNNPKNPRLEITYDGAQPDMLKDEAQAILTGRLDAEGVFVAEELLLKCPSKYEEALPDQVDN